MRLATPLRPVTNRGPRPRFFVAPGYGNSSIVLPCAGTPKRLETASGIFRGEQERRPDDDRQKQDAQRHDDPGGQPRENIGESELFARAFAALARDGRLVTAGGHGGGIVPLDVNRLYHNNLTVIGSTGESTADVKSSLEAAAAGKFKVLIDTILPLSEAARAHELVAARLGIGKVVLDPTRLK